MIEDFDNNSNSNEILLDIEYLESNNELILYQFNLFLYYLHSSLNNICENSFSMHFYLIF